MKVIAYLKKNKDQPEDALMVQLTESEFEKIMGLEGREHNTKLASLPNKNLEVPNLYSELGYLNKNRKVLHHASVVMLDMSKQLRTLLPEAE